MGWHTDPPEMPEDEAGEDEYDVDFEAEGEAWDNTFDSLVRDQLSALDAASQVEQSDIKLSPILRATFVQVDVLVQLAHQLHVETYLVDHLGEEWPELVDMILSPGVLQWVQEVSGEDMLAVLDIVTAWNEGQFDWHLAATVAQYMREHDMSDHLHAWVWLPGGFPTEVQINQEDPHMLLPVPPWLLGD